MNYKELKKLFSDHESNYPQSHLTGYVTFSSFGPNNKKEYPWESRTYLVSSDNKAFQPNKGGYSIFGSCLDGSDQEVRLEQYMQEEYGGKDGWVVEDCCVVGYLLIECSNYNVPDPKLLYSYSDALECMLSRSAEKSGIDVGEIKKRYASSAKILEGTYGCGWGTYCAEGPDINWLWRILPICIYAPLKIVIPKLENTSYLVPVLEQLTQVCQNHEPMPDEVSAQMIARGFTDQSGRPSGTANG